MAMTDWFRSLRIGSTTDVASGSFSSIPLTSAVLWTDVPFFFFTNTLAFTALDAMVIIRSTRVSTCQLPVIYWRTTCDNADATNRQISVSQIILKLAQRMQPKTSTISPQKVEVIIQQLIFKR